MLNEFLHRRLHAPYTLHAEILKNPKKPRRTVVMLHGIGSSTLMWHNVASRMPDDVRIIAIDLLGFGKSPDPGWTKYDAKTQANSIIATLLLHRIPIKSLFVGHSLGALVTVEIARRFPLYVGSMLLVSPPIYKPSRGKIVATQKEDVLRGMYKILYRNRNRTEKALLLARRYYIKRTGAKVSRDINVNTFLAALESAVINQSTIEHIADINVPIVMMSGTRDPVIVTKNLQKIAQDSETISHEIIKKAGHNVVGIMQTAVSDRLYKLLDPTTTF